MKLRTLTRYTSALYLWAMVSACSGGEGVVDSVATIEEARRINEAVSCATQVVAPQITTEAQGSIERSGTTSCPGQQGLVRMDSTEATTGQSTLVTTVVSFESCRAMGVVIDGDVVVEEEAGSDGALATRSHAALRTSLGDCKVETSHHSGPNGHRTARGTLCGFDIQKF